MAFPCGRLRFRWLFLRDHFSFSGTKMRGERNDGKPTHKKTYGCFLKWWYPATIGFPTKNDHFGVFWGYHYFYIHIETTYFGESTVLWCWSFQGCKCPRRAALPWGAPIKPPRYSMVHRQKTKMAMEHSPVFLLDKTSSNGSGCCSSIGRLVFGMLYCSMLLVAQDWMVWTS